MEPEDEVSAETRAMAGMGIEERTKNLTCFSSSESITASEGRRRGGVNKEKQGGTLTNTVHGKSQENDP
jgi:hypothetical protein